MNFLSNLMNFVFKMMDLVVKNDDFNANVQALGLPTYIWGNEASSGVASGRDTQTTKFAFPTTTAMSFNRSLWAATGRQIGREARAESNKGDGYVRFIFEIEKLCNENDEFCSPLSGRR